MEKIIQYFLPIYAVLFLVINIVWRTRVVNKQIGSDSNLLHKATGVQKITGLYFKIGPVVMGGLILLYCGFNTYYSIVAPIEWMELAIVRMIGMGALFLSWIWITVSQIQMGRSWRVGVDADQATNLVQKGVFKLSRNPIFLGLKLAMIGLFMTLPNAVTLAVGLLQWVLIDIQVAIEESYLLKAHDKTYQIYCNQVPRWI